MRRLFAGLTLAAAAALVAACGDAADDPVVASADPTAAPTTTVVSADPPDDVSDVDLTGRVAVATATTDDAELTATVWATDVSTMECPTLDGATDLVLELRSGEPGARPDLVELTALNPGSLPSGSRLQRTTEVTLRVNAGGAFVASVPVIGAATECLTTELSGIELALLDGAARPAAVTVGRDGDVTEVELPVDPTTWEILPDAHVLAADAWSAGEPLASAGP